MITVEEMIELENKAEAKGVSKLKLMERAGKGVADIISVNYDKSKITFVCYHGNNGGDGFAAAYFLLKSGCKVKVLFIGDENKLKPEAEHYFKLLPKAVFVDRIDGAEVIVDCMLGIGAKGKLKDVIKRYVKLINSFNACKISVDLPTGLYSGEDYVKADLVITMHDLKPGLDKFNTEIVAIGL